VRNGGEKRVLKSIHWDIYTIVIAALVPAVLLTAWGLTEWDEARIRQQQCAVAESWLNDSAQLAPMFENAETMDSIATWITDVEEINSPASAGQLRHGILTSARYHAEYYPDESTLRPGVLNPRDGLYERTISEGAENLVQHCPDVEPLLPNAFPMVFIEEGSN
jgi:hypothetical protein